MKVFADLDKKNISRDSTIIAIGEGCRRPGRIYCQLLVSRSSFDTRANHSPLSRR